MERPAACTRVGHLAHHAASRPVLWDQVAEALKGDLEARAIGFFEHDRATHKGSILYGAGIAAEHRALYRARFAARNPWLRAADVRATEGRALSGGELVPNWELVRTDFYRVWLRPQGLLHALVGILSRTAETMCAVIALRPLDGAGFGSADRNAMTGFLQELRCAWRLGADFTAARSLSDVLLDLLATLPEAAMIVGQDARPAVINRAAECLLQCRDGLGLSEGRIIAASAAETARLRRVIAAVAAENGAGAGRVEIVVDRPSNGRPLLVQVEPVGHKLAGADGTLRRVAAVVVRPAGAPAAAKGLSRFYRMTPMEARLAALIVDGMSLLDAAAQLHVTRNTARTHMKRIYAKTDTHRQVELVRLLGASFDGPG